jgi:hypothetical protein
MEGRSQEVSLRTWKQSAGWGQAGATSELQSKEFLERRERMKGKWIFSILMNLNADFGISQH